VNARHDQPLSAVVLLSTAGGRPHDEEPAAANGEPPRPERGASDTAREHFAAAGFEVGAAVGGTFSITAAPALFERHFGVGLMHGEPGWVVEGGGDELPVDALSEEVRAAVEAIAIQRPPDFGPTSY
jgi:hypothetical protein